jgi:hypothetical protein
MQSATAAPGFHQVFPTRWQMGYYSNRHAILLLTMITYVVILTVDPVGIEPTTSTMPLWRAPSCAMGPYSFATAPVLVDLAGFEPATSSVRLMRAPNCATGPGLCQANIVLKRPSPVKENNKPKAILSHSQKGSTHRFNHLPRRWPYPGLLSRLESAGHPLLQGYPAAAPCSWGR